MVPLRPTHIAQICGTLRYDRSITRTETDMRKPRDFDAAIKTLTERTKAVKENKRRQLGELVVATGADTADMETLAGALLSIGNANTAQRKEWREQGVIFFRTAPAAETKVPGGSESPS